MAFIPSANCLAIANILLMGVLCAFLLTKITKNSSVPFLIVTFLPLALFEIGSYLFLRSPSLPYAAEFITAGLAILPLALAPVTHALGQTIKKTQRRIWLLYYVYQSAVMVIFCWQIVNGHVVEWVTGILDEPLIVIEKQNTLLFLNILVSLTVTLLCLDGTLRTLRSSQLEALKFVFIALLGFVVYFGYVSFSVLLSGFISQSILVSGTAVIFLGLLLLSYSFVKYPFWQVRLGVSRKLVFGCLSASALILYVAASASILDIIRIAEPAVHNLLLPVATFSLTAVLLTALLSPWFRKRITSFLSRNFFNNKYDYRELWMQFAERCSGSLSLPEVLPKIGEFIADNMFVRQVSIWLRSPDSEILALAYCLNPVSAEASASSNLRFTGEHASAISPAVYHVVADGRPKLDHACPFTGLNMLGHVGISRFVPITKGKDILGGVGVGPDAGGQTPTAEDDQLLTSIAKQIGQLILNQKLSEELLLAREWESFNRFASFVVHDLKNLATLQGMVLENGNRFGTNSDFLADAFATFRQTTDKMINLIASLSVQRGQFSLKQQPVNILEVIASTFDDLKLDQRNGVRVVTAFPPKEKTPIVSGDPELLQKAFTNLLLNAIQSLPKGEGAVEVSISEPYHGRITAAIKDNGCGIPSGQLKSLFRPFQTTKKKGMGIGLCHTRSIIEVHGGHIRIDSKVNSGTKVEIELPVMSCQ